MIAQLPSWFQVMRDLGQVPDTHPKWIMLDGTLAIGMQFFGVIGAMCFFFLIFCHLVSGCKW